MIAGFAGHQNLGDEGTLKWVQEQLTKVVLELTITGGWTSLAAGADQLFAQVLLEHRIPYMVVVPCQSYEKTFSEQELTLYRLFRSKEAKAILLGFDEPSEIAFYEAGKRVVDESELLIAVWDGAPAHGLGGTGDIVQYAQAQRKIVIHVNHVLGQTRKI